MHPGSGKVREFARWEWLETNARQCGFGSICFAQVADNSDAIAGYIVKTAAGGSLAVAGEITKSSQLPVNAPQGFRRIRASVGFLPPKFKSPTKTGAMIFAPTERVDWGEAVAEAETLRVERRAAVKRARTREVMADADEQGLEVDAATGEILWDYSAAQRSLLEAVSVNAIRGRDDHGKRSVLSVRADSSGIDGLLREMRARPGAAVVGLGDGRAARNVGGERSLSTAGGESAIVCAAE